MHLQTEANEIARQALEEARRYGLEAQDLVHEICDGHAVAIYYGRAIKFCADQDTSAGEEWLEEVGGITQPGDTFGTIACRIAFATLYVAAQTALFELESEEAAA